MQVKIIYFTVEMTKPHPIVISCSLLIVRNVHVFVFIRIGLVIFFNVSIVPFCIFLFAYSISIPLSKGVNEEDTTHGVPPKTPWSWSSLLLSLHLYRFGLKDSCPDNSPRYILIRFEEVKLIQLSMSRCKNNTFHSKGETSLNHRCVR